MSALDRPNGLTAVSIVLICIFYICYIVYNIFINPWSRVLPENLTVSQLHKKFPTFYETRTFITAFTRALHLSIFLCQINSVHAPVTLVQDLFYCYPPIYAWVFQVVSFPHVFPLKSCMHLYSPPYVLHSPPLSVFLIWSPEWYLVRSTEDKVPCYVVFSTPLLPRPSLAQIFFS